MKKFLTLVSGCCFLICSCNSHTTQEEKKIVDEILKGKEVQLSKMPYSGNKEDGNYYTPYELGSRLGYSEEDLKKLSSAVVKLPTIPSEEEE